MIVVILEQSREVIRLFTIRKKDLFRSIVRLLNKVIEMYLREKRLDFRTKHRKRCLRDRKLRRFRNKSIQDFENNNHSPIMEKPVRVSIYDRYVR